MKPRTHQFIIEYGSITRELKTPVYIGDPHDPSQHIQKPKKNYTAIWDTGATNTVITSKVVKELNLKPIGKTTNIGVNSQAVVNTYLVSIVLPNNVTINSIRVSEAPNIGNYDVLIGMDIISHGDFAISNVGQTRFSFRMPSIEPEILKSGPVHSKRFERNHKVRIKNNKTGEEKTLKWKQAQPLVEGTSDWDVV